MLPPLPFATHSKASSSNSASAMRNPVVVITGSSSSSSSSASSIFTAHRHHHRLSKPKLPLLPTYKLQPSPPPSSSSPSSLASTLSKPLLPPTFNPSSDGNDEDSGFPASSLSYYAEIASVLIEEGRFEEFSAVVDAVVDLGANEAVDFGRLLNLELLAAGIGKGLKEGRVRGVVQLLSSVGKLRVNVLGLIDGVALESITVEVLKIVRDGNLEEAVEFMELLSGFQFSVRHLVDPNEMIRKCVGRRKPHIAVRYASLLPHVEILFCTIIKEFGKKGDLVSALTVYEASKQKLASHNMFIYRSIIDTCGLCGDSFKSRSIYEDLLKQKVIPNIYVFNSVMNVNAYDLSYTMDVYKEMQELGVDADMTSYNVLLKACCLAGRVDLAQDIYGEVRNLESTGVLKLDLFTYSTIIKVFADANLWQMAMNIKEDMLSTGVIPNTVTWSSLISACANAGHVDQAIHLFNEMLLAGCKPNSQCFNTILHACVEARQYDRVFRLFETWKAGWSEKACQGDDQGRKTAITGVKNIDGKQNPHVPSLAIVSQHARFANSVPFRPTAATYNILMKACGSDFYRAKALMDEMKIMGLSPNHITWSVIINIFGNAGNVDGALQTLKSMREAGCKPDVVAYTATIKTCVKHTKLKQAFSLYSEMKRYGIKPNLVTYNMLLRARDRYGSFQEVLQCLAIYQDMRKAGYKANDYYLKQLIEEWCEGVIYNNNVKADESNIRNTADTWGPENVLLERIALHLQQDTAERLVVDIQGLTKVEARIVVLAVLRMIKENHSSGYTIDDDLIIILGMRKLSSVSIVKDTITRLLKDELGLEVVSAKPRIHADRYIDTSPSPSSDTSTKDAYDIQKLPTSATRRPAVMQKLIVTRKSLCQWLLKRSGAAKT